MARKLKPDESPSIGHNGPTDEQISDWIDRASRLLLEFERKAEEAKTAQSHYRAELKAAKKAGVNVDMLREALKLRKREPEDVDRDFRDLNRILRVMGLPIGTQLGLFDDGRTVATAAEDDQIAAAQAATDDAEPTMVQAYHMGEKASQERGGPGVCPFSKEMQGPLRESWFKGYNDDQAKTVVSLTPKRSRKANGADEHAGAPA